MKVGAVPTDLCGHVEIFPAAHLKAPFPSGTPSFLFKKIQSDGTEWLFGAVMELLDRDDIFDGQSSRAILHCWTDVVAEEVSEGAELVIWYNKRELGRASVDGVVHVEPHAKASHRDPTV